MKHEKKSKKKKSYKSGKKAKKSDREERKQRHKEKKKRHNKLEKIAKIDKPKQTDITPAEELVNNDSDDYCGPSIDLMNRAKCPETKAEYDHRQNQIKRVVDPETGRIRLIKGDGEILEEIVTRDRHQQINKAATQQDGFSFQKNALGENKNSFM